MAIQKPVWDKSNTDRAAATLAASASANVDYDLHTLGADVVKAQIDITIGSSSGVTVKVFHSPDGGTTYDDRPLHEYEVNTNDIRTLTLRGSDVRVNITNDDGSNATGNIAVISAWRQWDIT